MVELIVHALHDGVKKASLSLGLGALAMGLVWYLCTLLPQVPSDQQQILMSLGAFFIAATVGRLLDKKIEKHGEKVSIDKASHSQTSSLARQH